ncbi:MAG TPA: ABC transporter permease [Kofleriaceae bacterium]|nr:ABC transporter permease [Kofleriaceae bacterium]
MIGATIRKDVWLLLRDRGRLLSLFALPIVFIVVFGSMFNFGPSKGKPRPIPIWHAQGDARGEAIERALAATPGFAPEPRPSADDVRHAVADNDRIAGLVVPASGPVELVIDLAAPIQVNGPIQGALTGVVMKAQAPVPLDQLPPLVVAKSPPGVAKPLDQISSFQVTVPGNAVLFAFFISMTVAMSFASERTTGTWRRLLAAPVPRWKALIGKLVPYYLIGCIQLALLFGLGVLAFGMKVAGSPLALCALSGAVVLCAVSFGLLAASFGWTEKQIGSIVPVIILVMGLLGGCMFPRLIMPPFMQQLGHAVPQSWALDGYYDVLVRQSTTLADIAPSIGALLAFSAGFALLGLWRFNFEK